jgi:hypothetical protein
MPLASPEPAALSPVEAQERLALRENLRLRRSVDHFARAWYGSIASLILTGIALKLLYDHLRFRWSAVLVATLGLVGWSIALVSLIRSRRAARGEREMLRRLQALDLRAPKPPELF